MLALVVTFAALLVSARDASATTISVSFTLHVKRIAPEAYDGPFKASFTLVLDERGGVTERYDSSGRYGKKNQKTEVKLGETGSTTTYRVVDQDTIERSVNWADHTDLFTVKVSGKTCSMSFDQKKSGPTFKSFSTALGVMATYTSMRLVNSSCAISD